MDTESGPFWKTKTLEEMTRFEWAVLGFSIQFSSTGDALKPHARNLEGFSVNISCIEKMVTETICITLILYYNHEWGSMPNIPWSRIVF